MTFYLVYPLLLYICPVRGKDHSITLVLLNDRCQKVLNLLKKTLDYMEREVLFLLGVKFEKRDEYAIEYLEDILCKLRKDCQTG